ncbi:MAG: hypothetical protein GF393_05405 [Armatimonadia bacterium]|nr:hypothetical protein [Armatimonadia bacterium]
MDQDLDVKGMDARIMSYVVLAAVIGFAVLWTVEWRHRGTAREAVQLLEDLPDDSFDRIDVFTKYGDRQLGSVTDPDEVASFVRALKTAQPYHPNHPTYTDSWYLWLRGEHAVELTCSIPGREPELLVCRFTDRFGRSKIPRGSHLASPLLRIWASEHLIPLNTSDHPEKAGS